MSARTAVAGTPNLRLRLSSSKCPSAPSRRAVSRGKEGAREKESLRGKTERAAAIASVCSIIMPCYEVSYISLRSTSTEVWRGSVHLERDRFGLLSSLAEANTFQANTFRCTRECRGVVFRRWRSHCRGVIPLRPVLQRPFKGVECLVARALKM